MSFASLAVIIASVMLSAAAQISFKIGVNSLAPLPSPSNPITDVARALLTPGVLGGLGLYGVGTLLWLGALGRVEISQAYPFVGLGFALTTLAGYALFGDQLTWSRIVGIALIFAGIVFVARS